MLKSSLTSKKNRSAGRSWTIHCRAETRRTTPAETAAPRGPVGSRRSAGKLGDAGFDEETIELIVSLKHHLKRAAKLDVVFDAIECKRRDDVKQYFRMADDELALIRKAGSRDILVAMDAQRRATNPDITNCAPNLTFDGEPVTAFFYSLSKDDARRRAEMSRDVLVRRSTDVSASSAAASGVAASWPRSASGLQPRRPRRCGGS